MKRIIKNPILTFILGAIIFGSVGVLASDLLASQITYNNTTVDGALNDLYTKAEKYNSISFTLYHDTRSIYNDEASIFGLPKKYSHFIISNINIGDSASCVVGAWSSQQSKTITLNPQTEYEIGSETDGYKLTSVNLNSKSKNANEYSRCSVLITLYNKN